jgi:hypothetical protein
MSLNKFRTNRSNSFISNLTTKKTNDHKIRYLDEPQFNCLNNISLFNHVNTFFRPNEDLSSFLTNNNSNFSNKYSSLLKNKDKFNIRENNVTIENSNNTIHFDYNKKAIKQNLNKYKYLFTKKNYSRLNYLNKRYYYKNNDKNNKNDANIFINDKFTPKSKLKAMNIYKTLRPSNSQYFPNSINSYNIKEYNGLYNEQKSNNDNNNNIKINNFIHSYNSANRFNRNINNINKSRIKTLFNKYKSQVKTINRNFSNVNTINKENNDNYEDALINKRKLVKSLSDNCLEKKNGHVNNNGYIYNINNEQNNKELKLEINNYKDIINENNEKKPIINNYLNKFKGNQKKIMEECISKLNFNYSDDNYNYNYKINYNDIDRLNNGQENSYFKEPINQENQINNDNDFSEIINDEKENIINNIKNNFANYETLNKNENENYFSEDPIKLTRLSLDIKEKKDSINSLKNENRKNMDYNLIYPDENVNYINRTAVIQFQEQNKNDVYHPILFDDNKRSKYTNLIKQSQQKLELLLNKIPKHEYTKGCIKDKYAINISNFINIRKKRIGMNKGKESNESKLIKYINKNKNNIIMPPNGII